MHNCHSLLVSCLDFRIQKTVEDWARQNLGVRNYDRVTLAGGAKDFQTIMKQIDLSVKLHGIKKVVLMNHQDCGAYGESGTEEKHRRDLLAAASAVKSKYPSLQVETYFVTLSGQVVTV